MVETIPMWMINGHEKHTCDPGKFVQSALSDCNKAELLRDLLEDFKVKQSALQKGVGRFGFT